MMQGGASYTHCRCSSARTERTCSSLSTEPLIQPLLSKLLLSTNLSMSLAHFTAFTEVGKATAILFAYNYSTWQRDRLDGIINFLFSIHLYVHVQIYIIYACEIMPFASNRVRKQYDHAYFLLNKMQPNCNLVCLVCQDKTFQALHSCSMGTSRRTWGKEALI